MHNSSGTTTDASKRPWSVPVVEDLAPLEELTLQTPVEGGEGGFSWLDVSDVASRVG